jgi:hypothetical protein
MADDIEYYVFQEDERPVSDWMQKYPADMREALFSLPANIQEAALAKLGNIESRLKEYPMGCRPLHVEELKKALATLNAGAHIHLTQTHKIAAGHKNAQPERLAYAHTLLAEFMAIDLDDPRFRPIAHLDDSEGFTGTSTGGRPYTAAQVSDDGNTASCLEWYQAPELNGVRLHASVPTHWHAVTRTRYGAVCHGFANTRHAAIADAKSKVEASEQGSYEISDKEWTHTELKSLVPKQARQLDTIAWARGLPRNNSQYAALIALILKDQELKRLTGDPYSAEFTGTPRTNNHTRTRSSTERTHQQQEELKL